MPDFVQVAIRSLVSYIVLLLMTRAMGKKQISRLTFFDYTVGVTVGSLAGSLSTDPKLSLGSGITALVVWSALSVLSAWASIKSYHVRHLLNGRPEILVQHGKILDDQLRKSRITSNELLLMLRNKDAFALKDVELAVLETNGELSVLKKPDMQPATASAIGVTVPPALYPSIVVLDGRLMEDVLAKTGHDEQWLLTELRKQGAPDIEHVFLAQIDVSGGVYADFYGDHLYKPL